MLLSIVDSLSPAKTLVKPQVASAMFYGVSSFMIMVVNKRVLTVYGFPSFQVLGIGQVTPPPLPPLPPSLPPLLRLIQTVYSVQVFGIGIL